MRVQAPDVETRHIAQLVINASGKAVTGAVVPVFAEILAFVCGVVGSVRRWSEAARRSRIALHGGRGWLKVVDPASVPVVAAADDNSEPLVGTEALANGS